MANLVNWRIERMRACRQADGGLMKSSREAAWLGDDDVR
jgi:hypothetical protein